MSAMSLEKIRRRLLAEQGGVCAICGTDKATRQETPGHPHTFRTWAVDHCHVTGFVRGVLCRSCNSVLGFHRDSVEALADRLPGAVAYLSRPPSGIPYA